VYSAKMAGADFETPTLAELLRISIKLSDKEELHNAALKESRLTLSEEDKQWLIDAMGVRDKTPGERMLDALAAINSADEPVSRKEYALDMLLWFVEDIDNANDFVRFDDGVATMLRLLADELTVMRLGGAWILGVLVQNNPAAQDAVLAFAGESAAVPRLIVMAQEDLEVEVRRKALLALSGLARNSESGQSAFLAGDGDALLAALLVEPEPDSATHLLREAPAAFAPRFGQARADVLSPCAALVGPSGHSCGEEDVELREQALRFLQALAESGAVEEVQSKLGSTLAAREEEIATMDAEARMDRETELELAQALRSL
jgi:hypothetical protein